MGRNLSARRVPTAPVGDSASRSGARTDQTRGRGRPRGRTIPVRTLLRPFLGGQRRRLTLLSLASVIGGFAQALVLVLIARMAFALVAADSQVKVNIGPVDVRLSLTFLLVASGALMIFSLVMNVVQAGLTAAVTTDVLAETRKALIRSYFNATWALQAAEREGRLQELLTTYASNAALTVMSLAQGVVGAFSLMALVLTALFVSPIAASGIALAAGLISLTVRPLRLLVRRRSRKASDANLVFATALTELATTTEEVRIFGVAEQVRGRLNALTDRFAALRFRTIFPSQLVPGLYQSVALLMVIGALGLIYAVGASGIAAIGAVILLMLRSLAYGQSIQTTLQALHENAPYLEMLQAEQHRYEAGALPTGGSPVGAIGELAFEGVSFEYLPGQRVLHELSFRVPQGEIVGIVGPSGAGKSTLIQLVLRLRDPTLGRVLADGRDVRELALDDWYRHVTFVPQDVRLFAGTVAENIRFFREGISVEVVERAARRANLDDEIMAWPRGYDTAVGERGGEISGGQRQRLCIARALVDDPDLMVFDEPTSSLDAKSEALMRKTMAQLAPRTTVFIIAHRLSTLSICDRIMVIHDGMLQHFDEPSRLEEDNAFYREVLQLSGMR